MSDKEIKLVSSTPEGGKTYEGVTPAIPATPDTMEKMLKTVHFTTVSMFSQIIKWMREHEESHAPKVSEQAATTVAPSQNESASGDAHESAT